MDAAKRRKLVSEYKERSTIGGVYCILCSGNNHRWIRSTMDLKGIQNRFEFSISIKSAPEPTILKEFVEYGAESFSFVVLEELEKKETQSTKEFADDIRALYEIWLEKYENENLD